MIAFYIMLARPVGRFFTVLRMNFPVMLIAEDICGLRLGLCRYADIGIGLAPLVCHCKGLTVLVYFYFPLSSHHYCCIIRASLRQETGCFGNDVRLVDFSYTLNYRSQMILQSFVWHICHEDNVFSVAPRTVIAPP